MVAPFETDLYISRSRRRCKIDIGKHFSGCVSSLPPLVPGTMIFLYFNAGGKKGFK